MLRTLIAMLLIVGISTPAFSWGDRTRYKYNNLKKSWSWSSIGTTFMTFSVLGLGAAAYGYSLYAPLEEKKKEEKLTEEEQQEHKQGEQLIRVGGGVCAAGFIIGLTAYTVSWSYEDRAAKFSMVLTDF